MLLKIKHFFGVWFDRPGIADGRHVRPKIRSEGCGLIIYRPGVTILPGQSGGMADAEDLKSSAPWACGFESRLWHHGVADFALFATPLCAKPSLTRSVAPPFPQNLAVFSVGAGDGGRGRSKGTQDEGSPGLRFVRDAFVRKAIAHPHRCSAFSSKTLRF